MSFIIKYHEQEYYLGIFHPSQSIFHHPDPTTAEIKRFPPKSCPAHIPGAGGHKPPACPNSPVLPGYSALSPPHTQMTCKICIGLREKLFPDDVCYVLRRFLRHMTQDTLHAPRKRASKRQNTPKRSKTAVGGPAATPQGS